jgi:hypothetical protein
MDPLLFSPGLDKEDQHVPESRGIVKSPNYPF